MMASQFIEMTSVLSVKGSKERVHHWNDLSKTSNGTVVSLLGSSDP